MNVSLARLGADGERIPVLTRRHALVIVFTLFGAAPFLFASRG